MHRAGISILTATMTILACTACGSSNQQPPPASAATPASTTTPELFGGDPYIEVTKGVPFQISNEKGTTATVTLLQVEVDPACTTKFGPVQPATGTYVALEFEVATTANPPSTQISELWFEELTPEDFNKRIPFTGSECIGDRDKFSPFSPLSKQHGWVELDISNTGSSVLMSDLHDGRALPEIHRIKLTDS